MKMNPTRQHILETASWIVQHQGVAKLTIDAVAHEAGLSKGGVLYHFPSKDALIGGMMALHSEIFMHKVESALMEEPPGAGRWLRAFIRSCDTSVPEENAAVTGLIAAVANNPSLLDPLREQYAAWQERAEHDGLSPALATVLRLAIDGLWFADLLGLAPPQGALREETIQMLLNLAHLHTEDQ